MKPMLKRILGWYEKHRTLSLGVAGFLFTLQLVHLYWLTTHVVFFKLFGQSFFTPSPFFETLLIFVDYLEIPAIITTSLVYIAEYKTTKNKKSLLFLLLLNSQWVHIFWITDEFVIDRFKGKGAAVLLPSWLAWIAIMIDYLELPVIFDTLKEFYKGLKTDGVIKALEVLKE